MALEDTWSTERWMMSVVFMVSVIFMSEGAAAILGSSEMLMAITASTLTTICVFLPLIMYKSQLGVIGEIFQGLAFTVVISLVSSLVVAIVLVPVLSSKYFKVTGKKERHHEGLLGRINLAFDGSYNFV